MAFVSDQFFYTDMPGQIDEYVDFDQFLDLSSTYGDDQSASVNSTSHDMGLHYDADADVLNSLPGFSQLEFSDMANGDLSRDAFLDQSPDMGLMPEPTPTLDENMYLDYSSFDFRQLVEAQAAADPRIASAKEKRREAAIALHLQRLCDATALEVEMSSDSNTSFSSPNLSDSTYESFSPQSASASPKSIPAPPPTQGSRGMELVLDLNMNATTNLPKKQKPRSQAQKENYIKARKYGACEKHKRQHKQCNCLEKAAARAGVIEAPANVAFRERPRNPSSPMPVLPDSRSSTAAGLPRHISTLGSSLLRPWPSSKVIKKLDSTNGLQYSSSLSADSLRLSNKTRMSQNGTAAGHDPRLRPTAVQSSAVQTTARDGKHTSESPGHVQLRPIQPIPVAKKQTTQSSSRMAVGISPTNVSVATGAKNQVVSRTSCAEDRTPDSKVRRPWGMGRSLVQDGVRTQKVQVYEDQPQSPPREVRSSGLLRVSRSSHGRESLHRSGKSLETRFTRALFAPQSESVVSKSLSTGLLGQTGFILDSVTAQAGILFSRAVFLVICTCQSTRSLASSSENVIYRGLSFAGKHLMSAKKGLQLYQMQTFWSA